MKDSTVFLQHILESIDRITEFTRNLSKKQFLNSVKTQDAIIRRLEIIGEAAKNLPKKLRDNHPEIPWGEIIRMRDKLSHGYFGVDLSITWGTVRHDIPALRKKIKKLCKR